ncbi:MAG: peptidylprolyl isomerase [Patescibacteria group bacterium]
MSEETETQKAPEKKVKWMTLAYALLAVVLLFLAATFILAYTFPHKPAWVKEVTNSLPYPLVVVNYHKAVTFSELAGNMQSIKSFYENQDFSKVGLRVDFTTEEGQKRFQVREKEVLNKMIEDEAIALLARKQGITVTPATAEEGLRRKLEEYGSREEVEKDLARLYGWDLKDFEKKIVLPGLYEEKLREVFEKEVASDTRAKDTIEKAKKEIGEGASFDEVAGKYSEGQTASRGGELGWFSLEDLAPELRTPVSIQKAGAPGTVVESSLGFHILLVEEIKMENGKQLYRLSQVFVRKPTFGDWLSEKMKKLSVFVLTPEYRWNVEEARVEFRDASLREFEKKLYEETNGDALFFF